MNWSFFRMLWAIIGSPVVLIFVVLVGIATAYFYLRMLGGLR
jgi:hypothetical protein